MPPRSFFPSHFDNRLFSFHQKERKKREKRRKNFKKKNDFVVSDFFFHIINFHQHLAAFWIHPLDDSVGQLGIERKEKLGVGWFGLKVRNPTAGIRGEMCAYTQRDPSESHRRSSVYTWTATSSSRAVRLGRHTAVCSREFSCFLFCCYSLIRPSVTEQCRVHWFIISHWLPDLAGKFLWKKETRIKTPKKNISVKWWGLNRP